MKMSCITVKWVGIAGLLSVLLGILTGWVIVPKIVRSKIADILPLRRNSESWERWERLPVPIRYRVFIFNVNNPDGIIRGEIPDLKEMGPYVYEEKRIKTIVSVDEKNSKAVYEHKLVFEFNANESWPCTEDDVLTVVNAPAVLLGLVVDNLKIINPVIHLYNTAIEKMWPTKNSNPLFINAKVKDYLFNGIPLLCNQPKTSENIDALILCEALKILHPRTITLHDFGKNIHSFAFFKYKNEKSDGVYEIDLGINDVTKIGQILSWNDRKSLSVWKAESCNRIQGTDTTIFRPYLEEDDVQSLFIYHTDVCRSIKLVYKEDTEFKRVKGRRYSPDSGFLGSVLDNRDNHCYCPQSVKEITHYGGCLRSGVMELSGCQGAPVIVSYPHFLKADSSYHGNVKGLYPNTEIHETFLDLESNTGYPLRAASRIQINTFLQNIPHVGIMRNLPNILMPALWLEESMELTDELIDTINSQLLNVLLIVDILKWVVIGCGAILSMGACSYYFVNFMSKKREKYV